MKQIVQCMAFLLAALFLVSCDASDDIASDDEQVNIRFTLAVDAPSTRAGTWGDDDYEKEEATAWENAIRANKLQVLVYDSQDNFVCEVDNLTFVNIGQSPYNLCEVFGNLPIEEIDATDGKLACRLVILANFETKVSAAKGDPLSKIANTIYTYQADAYANKTTCIPMWGVQTYKEGNDTPYQPLTIKNGETAEASTIYMLRAVSKIRVSITDEVANDYALQGVSISDYNIYGYIIPSGYTADATTDLCYEGTTSPMSFNPYTRKQGSPLSFSADAAGKTFTVYLPECKTLKSNDTEKTDPYLSVTLKPKASSGTAATYRIGLLQDDDSQIAETAMNLIRNTIYEYTITSVGPDLSLRYQAIDWTTGGGDISFESRRK